MAAVRGRDTCPERVVRSLLHVMGYRFRLHQRNLPGSPDVVLPRLRAVVFIHGCFWHRHRCRAGQSTPATRRAFWLSKFEKNVARDERVKRELRALGWRVLTVWECQTKPSKLQALERRLGRFLESHGKR